MSMLIWLEGPRAASSGGPRSGGLMIHGETWAALLTAPGVPWLSLRGTQRTWRKPAKWDVRRVSATVPCPVCPGVCLAFQHHRSVFSVPDTADLSRGDVVRKSIHTLGGCAPWIWTSAFPLTNCVVLAKLSSSLGLSLWRGLHCFLHGFKD